MEGKSGAKIGLDESLEVVNELSLVLCRYCE